MTDEYKDTEQNMSKADLKEVFKTIDEDNNGIISIEEFIEFFKMHGKRISMEQTQRFILPIDTDQDGQVSFTEFVKNYRAGAFDKEDIENCEACNENFSEN